MRMLQAAAADLGSAWASALFLCTEREFWASRCGAAYLRSRSQSHLGLGWSNVEYHSYDCSRTYLHLYACLFEVLGFRRQDTLLEEHNDKPNPDVPGRAALVMEHQTSRDIVLLRFDATATDAHEDFGRVRLSPLTWHGHSGLWCALHGESYS